METLSQPDVGFRPQKPFSIAACEANSVFWRAAEKYRIRYLQAFFTLKSGRALDKEHLPPDSDAPSNVRYRTRAPLR